MTARALPSLMVEPPTALPPALPRRRTLTPEQAGKLLGLSRETVRRQLLAAPKGNGGRLVTEGPWAGTTRRGSHWKVPADVVERQRGMAALAAELRLEARVAALEAVLARVVAALSGGE